MTATSDDRLTAFLAWRRRRALEAGIVRPEQIIDEWVFRRMLLQNPKDIYALEDLRLLTAPLFAQYGEDLLAICQKRPTEDERPRSARRDEEREIYRSPSQRSIPVRTRRPESGPVHSSVRRDDPPVSLHHAGASAGKRTIEDFAAAPEHSDWKGRPFELRCSTLSFKFWETDFLEQWGALLDALASGELAAGTPDEQAATELASRTRKASKEWETAWVKVVLRRAYENV